MTPLLVIRSRHLVMLWRILHHRVMLLLHNRVMLFLLGSMFRRGRLLRRVLLFRRCSLTSLTMVRILPMMTPVTSMMGVRVVIALTVALSKCAPHRVCQALGLCQPLLGLCQTPKWLCQPLLCVTLRGIAGLLGRNCFCRLRLSSCCALIFLFLNYRLRRNMNSCSLNFRC